MTQPKLQESELNALPELSKLDPKWATYVERVETMLRETRAERDRYRETLERVYKYAYGASGVTGDDAGHLTYVGMIAKGALDG